MITAAPESSEESLQEPAFKGTSEAVSTYSVSDSGSEGAGMNVEVKSHSHSIPLVTIALCIMVLCLFGSFAVYILRTVKQRRQDGRSIASRMTSAPNYGTI